MHIFRVFENNFCIFLGYLKFEIAYFSPQFLHTKTGTPKWSPCSIIMVETNL